MDADIVDVTVDLPAQDASVGSIVAEEKKEKPQATPSADVLEFIEPVNPVGTAKSRALAVALLEPYMALHCERVTSHVYTRLGFAVICARAGELLDSGFEGSADTLFRMSARRALSEARNYLKIRPLTLPGAFEQSYEFVSAAEYMAGSPAVARKAGDGSYLAPYFIALTASQMYLKGQNGFLAITDTVTKLLIEHAPLGRTQGMTWKATYHPFTAKKLNPEVAQAAEPKTTLGEVVCALMAGMTRWKPSIFVAERGNTCAIPDLPLPLMCEFVAGFQRFARSRYGELVTAPPKEAAAAPVTDGKAPSKKTKGKKEEKLYRSPLIRFANFHYGALPTSSGAPLLLMAAIGRWMRLADDDMATDWTPVLDAISDGASFYVVSSRLIERHAYPSFIPAAARENTLSDFVADLFRYGRIFTSMMRQTAEREILHGRLLQLLQDPSFYSMAVVLDMYPHFRIGAESLFTEVFERMDKLPKAVVMGGIALGRALRRTLYIKVKNQNKTQKGMWDEKLDHEIREMLARGRNARTASAKISEIVSVTYAKSWEPDVNDFLIACCSEEIAPDEAYRLIQIGALVAIVPQKVQPKDGEIGTSDDSEALPDESEETVEDQSEEISEDDEDADGR